MIIDDDTSFKQLCDVEDVHQAFDLVESSYQKLWFRQRHNRYSQNAFDKFIKSPEYKTLVRTKIGVRENGPYSMKVIQEMLRSKGYVLRILYKPVKCKDKSDNISYIYGKNLEDKSVLQTRAIFMDRYDIDVLRLSRMRLLLYMYPIHIKNSKKENWSNESTEWRFV